MGWISQRGSYSKWLLNGQLWPHLSTLDRTFNQSTRQRIHGLSHTHMQDRIILYVKHHLVGIADTITQLIDQQSSIDGSNNSDNLLIIYVMPLIRFAAFLCFISL